MGRKVKYTYEFKLRCVKQVLNNHQTVEDVSKLQGCHHTTLHDWIRFYEKYGKKALLPRETKVYSIPFKIKVLEAIDKDSLSFSQACLVLNQEFVHFCQFLNFLRKFLAHKTTLFLYINVKFIAKKITTLKKLYLITHNSL